MSVEPTIRSQSGLWGSKARFRRIPRWRIEGKISCFPD